MSYSIAPTEDQTIQIRAVDVPAASFPIVGIGASIGGLVALQELLAALPGDTGMGFVVIQHLDPTHESSLADILSRSTKMPVAQVHDEPTVEPDHVYVIPPGSDMIMQEGRLRLLPQQRHHFHRGIDRFFRSLAEDSAHLAIGVVLSGGLSDGTVGLEEIKAAGGVTFAQDDSAQHESMPRSAVASGCVDFVLSPEKIALELERISRHSYSSAWAKPDEEGGGEDHRGVVELVRGGTGVDFTHYKSNTLRRRIKRRMMLHRFDAQPDYEEFLRQTPDELEALFQDILISVTSFFRDPESFDALARDVFGKLIAAAGPSEPVRIWVAGSSSGEEAYSLAMVFTECAERAGNGVRLQLFATDVNPRCVEKARAGWYPGSVKQEISPERLKKFFVEEGGGFRVRKSLRECCVFSRHNLLTDPPFSRVDFISCRNLLIYLEPVLQQKVMPTFHYALKPSGWLWLGSSESVGTARTLFEAVDLRHKTFLRKAGGGVPPRTGSGTTGSLPSDTAPLRRQPGHGALHRDAERLLLAKFSPPGVVVSSALDIVQFQGDTSPYLSPASGVASHHLLRMLREGLAGGVREALQRATSEGSSVRTEGLYVKSNGGLQPVDVEVIPITVAGDRGAGFIVLFDGIRRDIRPPGVMSKFAAFLKKILRDDPDGQISAHEEEILHLTRELEATRESLQAVSEQHEAVAEELRSANEEAQSANEEMQSVNEELETSKEEMEATNEELATLNEELAERNTELSRLTDELRAARDYLQGVFANARVPLLVLDRSFQVKSANQAFLERFGGVSAKLVGRKIFDLADGGWDVPAFRRLLEDVLPVKRVVENFELRGEFGDLGPRILLMNASLFQQGDDGEQLITLFIEDVTERVLAAETRSRLAAIVESSEDAIIGKSLDGVITTWNGGALKLFGYTAEEAIGQPITLLVPEDRLEEVGGIFKQIRAGKSVEHFDTQRRRKNGELVHVSISISPIVDESGKIVGASKIARDITERHAMEQILAARAESLAQADRSKDEFLAMLAHELRNPLASLGNASSVLQAEATAPAERSRALNVLGRQVGNMSRMIDDLLDVSRITEGKIELRTVPVSVSAILENAVATIRPLCDANSQVLTVELPAEPIYIKADATRLEQVFGNLLGNASKYGGRSCDISVKVESEGDDVIVRIGDNGEGIEPQMLSRIFELFVQSSRSLDRSHGGLGIGLTLVRRLVKLHGGTVEAFSEGIGSGSEFVVRLPTCAAPANANPAGKTPSANKRSSRILIIDDNVDSAQMLAMLQHMRGHVTCVAHSGPDGLAAAEDFKPEVILLDIGLPGMNGYEVVRRFRSMPHTSKAFVIAMSGYGSEEDIARGKEAGFDEHLVKPVKMDVLNEWLEVRWSS